MARANSKDGIRKLHLEEFPGRDVNSPKLTGVDYPSVYITRAKYHSKKKLFVMTTKPGQRSSGKSKFNINNLNTKNVWDLFIDTKFIKTIKDTDKISLEVKLDRAHDIYLKLKT